MLIFGKSHWPEHRRWFLAMLLISAASLLWYGAVWLRTRDLPGGSSLPGFAFGVAGGLIIIFEMLLWIRKRYRNLHIGRAKLWMKAHIWLGLLTVPLLVLHSGFRWWNLALSGVLMLLFFVVIASGVWGLALQQILPRLMLEELPAETIYSQIDRILRQMLDEARRLVRATCGGGGDPGATMGGGMTMGDMTAAGGPEETFLVIGAVRTAGRVQGKVLQTRTQAMVVMGAEPLLLFFEVQVVPFFESKRIGRMPLASSKKASAMFRELKTALEPAAHGVVDTIESLCDQRRQLARQARLHRWLHSWLLVHLPLSVFLLVLMFLHVVYALKYF